MQQVKATNAVKGKVLSIGQSLLFDPDNSTYMSRTPSVAGNRKTWTWSGWVKRNINAANSNSPSQPLFTAGNLQTIEFTATDDLLFNNYSTPYDNELLRTSAQYRDNSAWLHVVAVWDTTNPIDNDRLRLYVNGKQPDFRLRTNAALNMEGLVNSQIEHDVGRASHTGYIIPGYLAEIHFIDGLALDPTYFALETSDGSYNPIAYSGEYGTNGFYLPFKSPDLGEDQSGNGNDFTIHGINGSSIVSDSPSNNYCTMNPLDKEKDVVLNNGNLSPASQRSDDWLKSRGTFGLSSGKWYWELQLQGQYAIFGFADDTLDLLDTDSAPLGAWAYSSYGFFYSKGSSEAYGATVQNGDYVGFALDMDNGTIEFFKNGVSQGLLTPGFSGYVMPYLNLYLSQVKMNFGQRSWQYDPPEGFLPLCSQNLPDPMLKPRDHFNALLYTGDTVSFPNQRAITGVGFRPSLVWKKDRSYGSNHRLNDSVRGPDATLYSNTTDEDQIDNRYGYLNSFDSDGYTLQVGSNGVDQWFDNRNGDQFVSWNFRGGSNIMPNNDGSIQSMVSANRNMGFSVVKWDGTGSASTIGHGLGARPSMVIHKMMNAVSHWAVWVDGIGMQDNQYLKLNDSGAISSTDSGYYWNQSQTNSTVMGLGTNYDVSDSSSHLMYCFTNTEMLQVGSYVGNGLDGGPFISLPFKPGLFLTKYIDGQSGWNLQDSVRDSYNTSSHRLYPNNSDEEEVLSTMDLMSNGVKIRATSGLVNSVGRMLYLAISEQPFKYARGR